MVHKIGFPRIPLVEEDKRIYDLVNAIRDFGGLVYTKDLKKPTGLSGGSLSLVVRASKEYGFVDNAGKKLTLTDLGNRYVEASDKEDRETILLEAFLNVSPFKQTFIELQNMPTKFGIFKSQVNTLIGIPKKDTGTFVSIFKSNLEALSLDFGDIRRSLIKEEMPNRTEKLYDSLEGIGQPIQESRSISKLGYILGFIMGSDNIEDDKISEIVEVVGKESNGLKELSAEITTLKKMFKGGYIQKDQVLKYIKEKAVPAFKKDIGLVKLPFEKEEVKTHRKEEKNKE